MSQSEQDALRKEVFDYLRQLQKREEQAAKISGISSWVLVGAMWYLTAWFLDHAQSFSQQALLLGISIGLAFFFVKVVLSPRRPSFPATDARLMQYMSEDSSALGLETCHIGLAIVLPAIASFWLFGWTFPVVFGAIFIFIYVVTYMLGPLVKPYIKKPLFRSVSKPSKIGDAVMMTLTLIALVIHLKYLFDSASSMTKDQLVCSAYVGAMWWATLELVRTMGSKATVKNYERLEEALMFGIATPNDILKRLELQAFGPSLEKELNALEETIKTASDERASALEAFDKAFEETKVVPIQYTHEIKSRLNIAFKPLTKATDNLLGAIEEKVDYIGTLHVIRPTQLTPMAKQLIAKESLQLKSRFQALKEELRATNEKLNQFLLSMDEGVKTNRLSHSINDIEPK